MLMLNNKINKYIVVFGFSVFTFLTLSTSHAFAASQDLTVSPAVSQIKINPGQTTSGSFLIINQGKATYDFKVYATPYNVSGENYTPNYNPIPGAVDVSKWFSFSLSSANISPGQTEKVNYTITVPSNIQDGGYYAVAFGKTNNPKALIGVTINEAVGSLFFIKVGNNFVQKGSVESWKSNFFQAPPLTSYLKIQNTGSIYFKADFQYKVSDLFGGTKYLLNGQKFIFPQTARQIPLPWKNSPSFGLFKVSGNVTILGSKQYLGNKYVLVMSKAVRIYTIIIVVLIIISYIAFSLGHHRGKKKRISKHRQE